ncbi:MAG: hypothetical protein M3N26_02430 [Pseudomonadota bacterium]|nr:hypothetical protein [Pseudomonadota bacterium]
MTDPMAATPGWVDSRLETIFANLPDALKPAADEFADCLARSKAPAAPSDLLGTEFANCHRAFRRSLEQAATDAPVIADIMGQLEALEAEIAADS